MQFLLSTFAVNSFSVLYKTTVSGLIKYGERVYVLQATSSEQFRDSTPDSPLHCPWILEEYMLKKAEGYDVMPHEVIEVWEVNAEQNLKAGVDLSCCDETLLPRKLKKKRQHEQGGKKSNCCNKLLEKHEQGGQDKDGYNDSNKKQEQGGEESNCGQSLLAAAIGVLDFVQRLCGDKNLLPVDKDKYSNFNICVTFLLLSVAIFLEIYALIYLLFSDEAACWLKDHRPTVLDFVERVEPLYNRRRWSGSMGQYNLLSFALREKHLKFHQILELLHVDQKVLKFLYKDDVKVKDFLKERIIDYFKDYLKSQATGEKEDPSAWAYRGRLILKEYKKWDRFKWSIEIGFDQSILAWHIATAGRTAVSPSCPYRIWGVTATELLCHPEDPNYLKNLAVAEVGVKKDIELNFEMSRRLSRYMLYLLVMYPFLLPIGVGRVKFRDAYLEAMNFFTKEEKIKKNDQPKAHSAQVSEPKIAEACEALRKLVDPQVDPIVAKGDKSKFALYHGRRLAWQLDKEFVDKDSKWHTISRVWVEMLAYAAIKCKGHQHAQQLRQGGEFLTHIWLLMAHFGLTDHFQIPQPPAITELLVKRE
ncbi:hypothetical protein BT93_J1804 [Corymbia citriodora subsp. variegata]|nr:hypothetical protein BT93_J1804 [Corymbia citriodora subsp. variegata]